jgi:hypothetical protein
MSHTTQNNETIEYANDRLHEVMTDIYDETLTRPERNMLIHAYFAGLLYGVTKGDQAAAHEFRARAEEWANKGWLTGPYGAQDA